MAGKRMNGEGSIYQRKSDGRWFGKVAGVAYIVAYISKLVARTPLLFRTRHQHEVSAQCVRDSDERLLIRHCRPTFNTADVTLVDP